MVEKISLDVQKLTEDADDIVFQNLFQTHFQNIKQSDLYKQYIEKCSNIIANEKPKPTDDQIRKRCFELWHQIIGTAKKEILKKHSCCSCWW